MRVKSFLLLIMIMVGSTAMAQYVEMYRINQEVAKGISEDEAISALAAELQMTPETLKQQKAEHRLTIGELYLANALAKATKTDLATVVGEFRGGKPWGAIAKEKNIDMGPIGQGSKDIADALKKANK